MTELSNVFYWDYLHNCQGFDPSVMSRYCMSLLFVILLSLSQNTRTTQDKCVTYMSILRLLNRNTEALCNMTKTTLAFYMKQDKMKPQNSPMHC